MKNNWIKIALAAVAVFLAFNISEAKKNKAAEGRIEFAEKVYDFGKIKEKGGLATHEFTFSNSGTANVAIINASAECGCTRPSYSDAPVAPGKSGKVKVSYNPLGRPGPFEKVVTITTTGNPRKIRIKIRGTVVEN